MLAVLRSLRNSDKLIFPSLSMSASSRSGSSEPLKHVCCNDKESTCIEYAHEMKSMVLLRFEEGKSLVLTSLSSSGVMYPSLSTSNFSKAACDLFCHFSVSCSSS